MKTNQLKNQKISKRIRSRYIPAILAIFLLLFLKQVIIQYEVNQEASLSKVINIAGRQRMLSQRIPKDIYAIYLSKDKESRKFYLEELKEALQVWEISHIDLKNRNNTKDLSGKNSNRVLESYSEIETSHQNILIAAKDIITMIEGGDYSSPSLFMKVNIVIENAETFLMGMDRIVFEYDQESQNRITVIAYSEMVLFVFILFVILLMTIFIFIPVEKNLTKAFEEIEESHENMFRLFKTAHGALFVIDEKTAEVLLMNKQAEEFAQIDKKDKTPIFLVDILHCDTQECFDVLDKIKTTQKIDNMELVISMKGNTNISTLMSCTRIYYNKKAAILVGFFDITIQKQAEEAFKTLANKDELTGLFNRHFLDQRIKVEMERADRYDKPLSMIIMDLDHFKRINDTWGHPVGDEVLKRTAEIVTDILRTSDDLFRLGGEEFLILIPEASIQGAIAVAEKIRSTLNKHKHPIVGRCTASLGVSEKMKAESYNNWYKRTDEALYRAKENGRNCVVSFDGQDNFPVELSKIEWNNEWECGNSLIDDQHKELIEIANDLINMTLSGDNPEKVMQRLEELLKHILQHFNYEEQFLDQVDYPNAEKHAIAHKNLVVKAFKLKESYQNGELKAAAFFSFIMDDLILDHMLEADKHYFSHTKQEQL